MEDEHRVDERELKQDRRSLKVMTKEQETRHTEYKNAMQREQNKRAT